MHNRVLTSLNSGSGTTAVLILWEGFLLCDGNDTTEAEIKKIIIDESQKLTLFSELLRKVIIFSLDGIFLSPILLLCMDSQGATDT